MEEGDLSNEVTIQEMLVQGDGIVNQVGDGETLTINLNDTSQVILQDPAGDGSVQITPGTYQILTGEEIQLGEEMGEEGMDEVTQIEVPIEMLQEAVEMLQGQDIQGDAVEAAIANIAARHMGTLRTEPVGVTGEMEQLMEVTQSDIDEASTPVVLNSDLQVLSSADPNKAVAQPSDLDILVADTSCNKQVVTSLPDPQTSKPMLIVTSEGLVSKPRDMVSLVYGNIGTPSSLPVTQNNFSQSTATVTEHVTEALSTQGTNIDQPEVDASKAVTESATPGEVPPVTVPASSSAGSVSLTQIVNSTGNSLGSWSQEKTGTTTVNSTTNKQTGSSLENDNSSQNAEKLKQVSEPTPRRPPPVPVPDKKPDFSEPIEIKENLEITVGSKRCIVLPNPDTGQLCAYPLIPIGGKRKRGRPRKEIKVEPVEEVPQHEEDKENLAEVDSVPKPGKTGESQADAAESLLELSNTGPDGLRRSGRKRRKARTLKDYSILKGSSDDESMDDSEEEFHMSDLDLSSSDDLMEDTEDEEYKPTGVPKKRKQVDINSNPALFWGQKRGPGRPRRYPHPGQPSNPAQIPAILVNGQTIMIQGLENLTPTSRPLAPLMPKPPQGTTSSSPVIMMNNSQTIAADGSVTEVAAQSDTSTALEIPTSVAQTADGQATILQFSDDVVNMLMKKDPVKLGLKAPEADLEKIKCRICDFQAYYPQQYHEHIETHTDDVHKCKCCQYLTLDESEVIEHYKDSHPRSICPVCNFTAEQPYVVKRHMSRHDEKGCTCHICGKIYKDQYILKMHVKQVHMPADVLYECTVCGKKFTRKAHLKRHLRTHDVEKPFKCPHCDYRGCEKSDVAKHMLIHQEPKYVCEVCGKAFRHAKNKEVHVKRHSGQKDYKCGICGKYDYTFTDIRKHIERTHSDVKTSMFICEKCGSSFKDNQALSDHVEQGCEGMTIEQALSITTGDGGEGQATIQIPTSVLQADGQQITYDGQHLTIGGNPVNITVQHMNLDAEEDSIMLTEEQLAEAQIAVTDGDTQVISTAQMVTDLVEAGLAQVTQTVEAGLAQVTQTEEEGLAQVTQTVEAGLAQVTQTEEEGLVQVTQTVEAGLTQVTQSEEAGLAQVTQTVEAGQEALDQAVVISAAEAENSIVLS